MWPDEIEALARKGQQQDILRRAEREQLVRLFKFQPARRNLWKNQGLVRNAAGWLGHWLIRWGLKMQAYSLASPSKRVVH